MDCDDMKNSEITDEQQLAREVQWNIKSGKLHKAQSILEKLSPELRKKFTTANEELRISPALYDAIDLGDLGFVKFLVHNCDADIMEKALVVGRIGLSEQLDQRLSPLEAAIYQNRPEIFEYLVEIGADVEAAAKNKQWMHIACEYGSLKIVQILIERGAELDALDNAGIVRCIKFFSQTCLMKAVRGKKDNVELCRFLLDKGVDVNFSNHSGETALHFAAASDAYNCVNLLLERGADPFRKNNQGDDPLRVASMTTSRQIVKLLLETVFKDDLNRHIESILILGMSLFDMSDIAQIISEWKRATALYSEHQITPIPTTFATPLGLAVEAITTSELNGLAQDDNKFLLQMMVLSFKIFGPNHEEFFRNMICCAEEYFENGSFDEYLRLVMFTFQMTLSAEVAIDEKCSWLSDICNTTDMTIFHILWRSNNLPRCFETLHEFMTAIVEESQKRGPVKETDSFMDLIISCVFLSLLADFKNDQRLKFQKLVFRALRIGLASTDGRTLMMKALKSCFQSRHATVGIGFQRADVIKLLLDCGADVNERDHKRNSVIHVLIKSFYNPRESDAFKKLATMFIKSGVHLDARNEAGEVVASMLRDNGIAVVPQINLMCYAARAIRRLNIPYAGVIPEFLVDFVEMH